MKFEDIQLVVRLSDNVSFNDVNIDVLATIEDKEGFIIDEDTLLSEIELDVFSSDTCLNPSNKDHRAKLHALLDAFLDRAQKERAK